MKIQPSTVYIQQKIKACKEVGIKAELFHQPANIPVDELKTKIQELNRKPAIHAILVQLPLPTGWNTREVLSWVDPRKDPDCLTVENQVFGLDRYSTGFYHVHRREL